MGNIRLLHKKKKATDYQKLIDIGKIADKIDQVVFRSLLIIHPFSGRDTTSAVYGKGKTSIVQLLQKNQEVQEAYNFFMN